MLIFLSVENISSLGVVDRKGGSNGYERDIPGEGQEEFACS
jgi:hypothetical protein